MAGAHVDNHVEVGMGSHHYPAERASPAGGQSAGSWTWLCLGLWPQEQALEATPWALVRLSFAPGLLAGKW